MLYIIVIFVSVYFTHKIDKTIFFVRFENNTKFIKKAVNTIVLDDEFISLIERKRKRKKQQEERKEDEE